MSINPLKTSLQKQGPLLLGLLLCIIGATYIYLSTHWGPWAFSDSAAYVSSARNFNNHLGLSLVSATGLVEPLEIFPPLYPLTLSFIAKTGIDYLNAARVLDILTFAFFIFIFFWGTIRLIRNPWMSFIATGLLVISPVMQNNFSGIMTEPLFILLLYLSFFSTLIFIMEQKEIAFILAILFTAIAPLIRYIGIFVWLTNSAIIFLLSKIGWKKRILRTFVFACVSALPILFQFTQTFRRNQSFGEHAFTQPANLMAGLSSFFQKSLIVFQSWLPYYQYRIELIPDGIKLLIAILIAFLVFGLCLYLFFNRRHQTKNMPLKQLIIACLIVNIIYLCMFMGTYLLSDPQPPIITRMFAPILPSLVLWFISGLFFLYQYVPKKMKTFATVFLAALFILLFRYYALRSIAITKTAFEDGEGYTSREIQTSGFLQAIRQIPIDTPLIANTPALTLLYTNRMPYSLDFIPTVPLGNWSLEIDRVFAIRQAALILDYASIRNVYPDWKERLAYFTNGLDVVYQDEIGGIYYFPE